MRLLKLKMNTAKIRNFKDAGNYSVNETTLTMMTVPLVMSGIRFIGIY